MAGVRINCVCPAVVDTPLVHVHKGMNAIEGQHEISGPILELIEKQGGILR